MSEETKKTEEIDPNPVET